MARYIPTKSIPEFLEAYGVTAFGDDCPPDDLWIKVWDLYGTKPEDEDNAPGTGQFLAAIVYCEACDRNVQLGREDLDKG